MKQKLKVDAWFTYMTQMDTHVSDAPQSNYPQRLVQDPKEDGLAPVPSAEERQFIIQVQDEHGRQRAQLTITWLQVFPRYMREVTRLYELGASGSRQLQRRRVRDIKVWTDHDQDNGALIHLADESYLDLSPESVVLLHAEAKLQDVINAWFDESHTRESLQDLLTIELISLNKANPK